MGSEAHDAPLELFLQVPAHQLGARKTADQEVASITSRSPEPAGAR